MADKNDDLTLFHEQKRFLGEIEQGIRLANRELIHKQIPELSKDAILAFAVAIGRLRARYLEAAMHLSIGESGELPNESEIAELKKRREMYEEARAGFEALRYALERGYIDVSGLS